MADPADQNETDPNVSGSETQVHTPMVSLPCTVFVQCIRILENLLAWFKTVLPEKQGDQLNMAFFFWYLGKSHLYMVTLKHGHV